MEITFLGHAGFCVESNKAILIMDPWLSPGGAFDSSWFQFPRNHHLAALVQEKLDNSHKERFIYISHEHKDHLDMPFLQSLLNRDFTLIIPRFHRTALVKLLEGYVCKQIVICEDGRKIPIPEGEITLYLDDSEMSRDSAILIKSEDMTFFNMNDCKLHDKLTTIVKAEGPIDVFAAQYSGAIWHPTCYDYPLETYRAISIKKMNSKFEAVARAIETINPRVYLPSAGPSCFLDPQLIHLNFESDNIFPRAPKFLSYLQKRLTVATSCSEPQPGDVIDAKTGEFTFRTKERVTELNFESYIHSYASLYESFFAGRQKKYSAEELVHILGRLKLVLLAKLQVLTVRAQIKTPLYFRLSDIPERILKVNFEKSTVELTETMDEKDFYSITCPSWEVERILNGKINWDDFSLSFRMRLNRDPDVYQAVIHGYIVMEPEDMNRFCEKVLGSSANRERTLIEADECKYSINRYCPHQGADLTQGWVEQGKYLVCPKHRWQFDLSNGGKCKMNDTTIDAFHIEED